MKRCLNKKYIFNIWPTYIENSLCTAIISVTYLQLLKGFLCKFAPLYHFITQKELRDWQLTGTKENHFVFPWNSAVVFDVNFFFCHVAVSQTLFKVSLNYSLSLVCFPELQPWKVLCSLSRACSAGGHAQSHFLNQFVSFT